MMIKRKSILRAASVLLTAIMAVSSPLSFDGKKISKTIVKAEESAISSDAYPKNISIDVDTMNIFFECENIAKGRYYSIKIEKKRPDGSGYDFIKGLTMTGNGFYEGTIPNTYYYRCYPFIEGAFEESGEYRACVEFLEGGNAIASTGYCYYTFTKPYHSLEIPKFIGWDSENKYKATCSSVANAYGYNFWLYMDGKSTGRGRYSYDNSPSVNFSNEIKALGEGHSFSFKVRAISDKPKEYAHGEWSDLCADPIIVPAISDSDSEEDTDHKGEDDPSPSTPDADKPEGSNSNNAVKYSGKSEKLDWSISESGLLTISGSGDYLRDPWNGEPPWLEYADYITEAKVNVTDITSTRRMFCGCKKLKHVDLKNLDTSKVHSMEWMFADCTSLESLDLNTFDTGNVSGMWNMFENCSSLKELDLKKFNTSSVTSMNEMFKGCSGLTKLDLSNFDTRKVREMGWMFTNCNNLKELNISSFRTDSLEYLSGMFNGCEKVEKLDVGYFDTSKFESFDCLFKNCKSLKSLDVSRFDTSSAKSFEEMFYGCSGLTYLDVSNFDTSHAESMEQMFYGCSGLTNLDVSNFDTSHVESMSGLFLGCSGLKSLDLSTFNTSAVTRTDWMFCNCSGLTSVKRHIDGGGSGELISVNSPLRSCRLLSDGILFAV